jgi:transcription antitermination factor NusG
MKKFLAIYLGSPDALARSGWASMDEAKRKQLEATGIKAWGDWMTKHKASVVENGGPLGKTKRISKQGVAATKNDVTGYVVVQAESHEAAAKMFENHPHFTLFPGEAVEVMECLPIPGQ